MFPPVGDLLAHASQMTPNSIWGQQVMAKDKTALPGWLPYHRGVISPNKPGRSHFLGVSFFYSFLSLVSSGMHLSYDALVVDPSLPLRLVARYQGGFKPWKFVQAEGGGGWFFINIQRHKTGKFRSLEYCPLFN